MTCLLKAHPEIRKKDNHDAKEKSSDNQSTSANHDDQTNKIKSNQDEHDSQSSKPHTQQKPSQNDRKIIIDKNDR